MEIYVYTNTPKGGIKEYRAFFSKFSKGVAYDAGSNKWWTGLHVNEGVVKGQGVWFKEPNMEKAIALFKDKEMDRAIDYINRSNNAYVKATP